MNLNAAIEKESASIQTSTAKIEEVAAEIAAADADLAAATKIRNKENDDFKAFEADISETINTLERAIGVIEKELNAGAAMVQFKRSGNVVQALKAMVSAEAISSSDGKRLTALVQSDSDEDDSGAPAAAVYESSSGGVVGVLNDLLEKANTELEGARATETASLQNYEMLKGSLTDQIKFATKEMTRQRRAKLSPK